MTNRLPALLLLLAAPLLLLAIAGCGDDDDDDDDNGNGSEATATAGGNEALELYFQDLTAIQDDLNSGIETIDEQSQAAFVDPAAARQTLNAVSDTGQAALSDLRELDVPAEASDAHADLEDAAVTYLSSVDSLADDLQNIESGPEYDEFLAAIDDPESEYSQAKAGLQEACDGIQMVADDNAIEVTLTCPV